MSVQPEIAAARDDVQRTRDEISHTIAELEERVFAPARAVRQRLDVGRVVQDHPWVSLAIAVGAGALVANSGADERAVALTVEKAREGGAAGIRMAKEAPARSRGALASAVNALGARLAMTVVDALRKPRGAPPAPEPHAGLDFVK